jgi:hypothetical protein
VLSSFQGAECLSACFSASKEPVNTFKTMLVAAAFVAGSAAVAQTQSSPYSSPYASGSPTNSGSHSVSGYTRSNGSYVAPSYATNPNSTRSDNYSTKGNVDPYTGKSGRR